MSENNVYEYVRSVAEKKFNNTELTPLQLLYGYAMVAAMADNTLSVFFENEEQRKEIEKIRSILEEHRLDLNLVKTAVPLIDREKGVDTILRMTENASNETPQNQENRAVSVLQKLVELPIPELPLLRKGHDLQDIFHYMGDETASSAASQNQAVPEEAASETPAETPEFPEDEPGLSQRERLSILINKCAQLREYLNEKLPGQKEAVNRFVQGYFRSEFLDTEENENFPTAGVILLAGPPEAESERIVTLTSEFLGIRIMTSGMMSEPTDIFAFLNENPKCFILLNEIESLPPSLLSFFSQVLTDIVSATIKETNKEINFKRALIICTTNAGEDIYADRSRPFSTTPPATILTSLAEEYENRFTEHGVWKIPHSIIREFLSAFNSQNIIPFDYPGISIAYRAIRQGINECGAGFFRQYGLSLKYDPQLVSVLLYSCNDVDGPDDLMRLSAQILKNEIYETGRHLENATGVLEQLDEINLCIDTDGCNEQTLSLFKETGGYRILYVGNADDATTISLPPEIHLICCSDEEAALQTVTEGDIRFVLIDPLYQPFGEQAFLSIDDRKSVGMRVFEHLSGKLPHVPIYIAGKSAYAKHDESVLLELGARDIIQISDPLQAADDLVCIGNMLYLQKKADELKAHRLTLRYNTSQKISEDNRTAEIRYYDFRTVRSEAISGKYAISDSQRPSEKFSDVIGAADAKKELQFFINYMKNPRPYMMNSTQPPKGILLYGPPGTGKTMLARAMAAESEASFFATTGSGFADKYVGESEKNIRQLFSAARKCAPSIIFIDEIDSIGKQRTGYDTHSEKELNTLIAEMDGFHQDPTRPVFVIAATNAGIDSRESNNGSVLDEALTRRFARTIRVDLPNKNERQDFLRLELKKLKKQNISDDAIRSLAERTPGTSLAILKNVIDTAARNAAMDGIPMDDNVLLNALDEYKYGEVRKWNEETAWATAIHESGHAYINVLSGEIPSFVTIVSRGNFGGYMAHSENEDKFDYSRMDYLWKIRTALAGRAAEMEFFDEEKGINTGVSGDLKQATSYALKMICLLGMDSDRLYSIDPEKILNTPMAEGIMSEVNHLLQQEMETTRQLIREGRDNIEALALYLKDNNQATSGKILELLGKKQPR